MTGYLCAISIVILFPAVFKIIVKLSTRWDHSSTCLIGKTTIVTGANRGIGYYTALDFAKRGARVILACRDKERAEKARNKIIQQTGNPNVVVTIVDFQSLTSIRAFAKQINDTEERLDILVNNAGAGGLPLTTTEDGLNLLMQINYFGPFLLTLLLLDMLKKSAPSRIVNVASVAAYLAKLNLKDLNAFPIFNSQTVNYGNTKLCYIIFTNELARKLKGSGVTVNSLHPSSVNTEFFSNMSGIMKIYMILRLFFISAKEGAQTSIYVAVSKDIEGVNGKYFDNCRIGWLPPMPWLARDKDLAKKVWEKTEECVKLTDEEKTIL